MQRKHYKQDVYRALASFREEEVLQKGDTINRAYRNTLEVKDYTRGTAFTAQYPQDTNEQLTVTTAKILPFYINVCVFA